MRDRSATRWWTLIVAAAGAVVLFASCATPRPAPVTPRPSPETTGPTPMPAGAVYAESQVEKPATIASGSVMPKYPDALRQSGVDGEVLVSFIVSAEGVAEAGSLTVIRSSHEQFSTAVQQAVTSMRFNAAEIGGRKVRQRVEAPFTFSRVR